MTRRRTKTNLHPLDHRHGLAASYTHLGCHCERCLAAALSVGEGPYSVAPFSGYQIEASGRRSKWRTDYHVIDERGRTLCVFTKDRLAAYSRARRLNREATT